MSQILAVYLRGEAIGQLHAGKNARFSFAYDGAWLNRHGAAPLSLSLPLRSDPFPHEAARPFFAGLLPEGEIRTAVARRHGISPANDFRLLEAIGGECAGAVSLVPLGKPPAAGGGYRPLSDDELRGFLSNEPRVPLFLQGDGARLSLAGAQDKLPVSIDGERILLPLEGAPTSHILKPPIAGLEETVQNEAFCMELASRAGLPVPASRLRAEPALFFEIERYDRLRDPDGRLVRLHQEDLCQALGMPPEAKYEAEGGPSLARCAAVIDAHSLSPAADRKALLSWVVFNVVIGNADAHAKNLALLHVPGGVRLAPFYDLLATQVYAGLSEKLAMKVGGENRVSFLFRRHWERFADAIGVRPRLVLATVCETAEDVTRLAGSLAEEQDERWGRAALRSKIVTLIEKNTKRVLQNLD